MKKIILFSLCLVTSAFSFAQLRVDQYGVVNTNRILSTSKHTTILAYRTGSNAMSNGYAIEANSNIDSISSSYGIVGTSTSGSQRVATSDKRSYGVVGNAGFGYGGWNFGVFGRLLNSHYGAGIYGTAYYNDNGANLLDPYAGYFNGNVHINGGLYTDFMLGPSTPEIQMPMMSETNGISDNESVLENLSGLSAVAYYKAQPMATHQMESGEAIELQGTASTIQVQNLSKKHYALCAEQLEEVYPDLVYTQKDGTKHINYIELIPLLVQSLSELNAELAELKGENAIYAQKKEATSISRMVDDEISVLNQNNPNPWNSSTEVKLVVAENVKTAMFYVYDLTGKQVYEKVITEKGEQTIRLTSVDFTPGMYIYSLITDGKVIETKRMIVTK